MIKKRNGVMGALLLAGLAGCGGGSGDSSSNPVVEPPPPATTTDVPVTVIDGPIRGVKVCADANNNGVCDPTEASATTDEAGVAVLKLATGNVGESVIVAEVGTDAVDADSGPVATAFVLKAPADRTAVVSPLTTMVQAQIDRAGGSTTEAEAVIKARTGLSGSPFDNYISSGGSAARPARLRD